MSKIINKTNNNQPKSKNWSYIILSALLLIAVVTGICFSYNFHQNEADSKLNQTKNSDQEQIQDGDKQNVKSDANKDLDSAQTYDFEPKSIVYQGKIGDLPITMFLNIKNGEIYGRYRYNHNEQSINLRGKIEKNTIKLEESVFTDESDVKNTGSFVGIYDEKSYTGEWENESKKINFTLNQVFNLSRIQLESGFEKECVPDKMDVNYKEYNISIISLVFSQVVNKYYLSVAMSGSGCNGSMGSPRVVYQTENGQNLNIVKSLAPDYLGLDTGGILEISPKQNYIMVTFGTNGGACAYYNFIKIYDIKKDMIVFDGQTSIKNEFEGRFYQIFKRWVSENEVEYSEAFKEVKYTDGIASDCFKKPESITKKAKY